MSTTKFDTTRHTLALAMRRPQWQRLITSIHKAQEAKGYDGRQFGKDEMRFFGARLIGTPVEKVARSKDPREFECYWVERTSVEHSDETVSVRYTLKAVYGDDLANVHMIAESEWFAPSGDMDETTALDFVKRSHFQTGRPTNA